MVIKCGWIDRWTDSHLNVKTQNPTTIAVGYENGTIMLKIERKVCTQTYNLNQDNHVGGWTNEWTFAL